MMGLVGGRALLRSSLAIAALIAPALAQENVLLVVLDDVGVDRVAAYDALENPPATPTMDRLASEGVRAVHADLRKRLDALMPVSDSRE